MTVRGSPRTVMGNGHETNVKAAQCRAFCIAEIHVRHLTRTLEGGS